MRLVRPLENLIDQLVKLPTIGPKTAQRLALFLLKVPESEAKALAQAILEMRLKVFPCSVCGYLTDIDPCHICLDDERDKSIICVAEETNDIVSIEKTGYKGQYYVLNKEFHVMEGHNLDEIDLNPLKKRLRSGEIKELILAFNPDVDGEIMSRFLASIADEHGVKVTKLAYGLPVGGDIEFTDELTLRRALEGRKEYME
ncbi:MAG TPA: recombination mediator RecR [Syntrophomonadaceae bacterium]|nr:recombination mediator RecR [Syntrophomonadaceae bacterium]